MLQPSIITSAFSLNICVRTVGCRYTISPVPYWSHPRSVTSHFAASRMELPTPAYSPDGCFSITCRPYFRLRYRDPGGVTGAKIKLDCHCGLKEIDHASIRLSLPGLSQRIHQISSYRRPNRTQRPVPSVREHERAATSRGFRRDDVEKELKPGKASGTVMLIQPRRMP